MTRKIRIRCDGCNCIKQPDRLVADGWVDCYQDLEVPKKYDYCPSCWAAMLHFNEKPATSEA